MEAGKILETERLVLREYVLTDAPFIIRLMNSPGWLEFIGDRNVQTVADAKAYLQDRLMPGYSNAGFGFWMVELKADRKPVGMCGFVQRDYLDHVDIGFALLPEYAGKGIGYEMAQACMEYGRNNLNFKTILGITVPENIASIALLKKLGLHFERTHMLSESEELLVFST